MLIQMSMLIQMRMLIQMLMPIKNISERPDKTEMSEE